MRRFPWSWVAAPALVSGLLPFSPVARGEHGPNYWAGNVSLSQPAVMPADESLEAAPMPKPLAPHASMPSRRVQPVSYVEPVTAPITNQARQALNFYGGYSARATLSQMPRRTPIQPATRGQMLHNGKPFQSASNGSSVSPYLNLFRDEGVDSESAPSYFAFVRPQMEQQEAAANQQRELQRLQRQLQRGAGGGAQYQSAGGPARYMDTAQFYGGWRK